MLTQTIASDFRIVNITATTTVTPLRTLLETALAGKSAPYNRFPAGTIIQVALTPDADVRVYDEGTGDYLVLPSGIRRILPIKDAIDNIKLAHASTTATVNVELYFGR